MKTFFKTLTQVAVLAVFLSSTINAKKSEVLFSYREVDWRCEQLSTLMRHVNLLTLQQYFCRIINEEASGWVPGLNWCNCPNAQRDKRIFLVFCQLNQILSNYPDKQAFFVHTSFAEGDLLQSYLLIRGLCCLGYKRIILNVIGPSIKQENVEMFKKYIQLFFPDVAFYLFYYLHAKNALSANIKSHSFDLVDVGFGDNNFKYGIDDYLGLSFEEKQNQKLNQILMIDPAEKRLCMRLTFIYGNIEGQIFNTRFSAIMSGLDTHISNHVETFCHMRKNISDIEYLDLVADFIKQDQKLLTTYNLIAKVIRNESVEIEHDFKELIEWAKLSENPLIFSIISNTVQQFYVAYTPSYEA